MTFQKLIFTCFILLSIGTQASYSKYECQLEVESGEFSTLEINLNYKLDKVEAKIEMEPGSGYYQDLAFLGYEKMGKEKALVTFGFFMGTLSFELEIPGQFSAAVFRNYDVKVRGYVNVSGEESMFLADCKHYP